MMKPREERSIKKNRDVIEGNPCDLCPLDCDPVETTERESAKILVVTSGPKKVHDVVEKRHMSGRAMKAFSASMMEQGFTKNDFSFHSATQCYYEREETPTKERKLIASTCREYMLRTIEDMEPDVIVPLGVEAATAVYGQAKKITKIAGILDWSEDFECHIFPMLDPEQVAVYTQNLPMFQAHARILGQLVENGFDQHAVVDSQVDDYEEIDDLQFLIDRKLPLLGFDLETDRLRWAEAGGRVLTMHFCPQPGEAYMLVWDHPERPMPKKHRRRIRRQLKKLLTRRKTKIVGHNLKFDMRWFESKIGFRFRIAHDTLVMAALVDENQKQKDLSTLTKLWIPEMAGYDDLFNRDFDKSKMADVPLDRIRGYGSGDTDACVRLFHLFWDIISKDRKLRRHYEMVSIPGLNAFASMEERGMTVNEARIDDLEERLAEHVENLRQSLLSQVPRSIKRAHIDKGLSFTRTDFVRDILFEHPDGFRLEPKVFTKSTAKLKDPAQRKASTSTKDHLPFFFDDCPFTEELAEYMKLDRLLSANIQGFREKYIVDGAIYPIYQLHVTVTGRTSSQDPNGQNFPKRGEFAKAYRAIFMPPPGCVMLECDLSQAELRIAADMARERTMMGIYLNNGDIHRRTALIVAGITEEEFMALPAEERGLLRFKAKAVNFGFLYGMGWRKFIIYAKTQYGVEFTEDEARRIREGFFSTYPGLDVWHRQMRAWAHQHKQVRSYSGRLRHLPFIDSDEEYIVREAERYAINSPVQEFGSSLGVMSMALLDQTIDPQYLSTMGFVHDAVYAYAPMEYAEWAAKTMKRYMEAIPVEEWFGVGVRVPIVAEVSFGPDGGKQWEMDGLSVDEPFDFDTLEEFDMDLPPQAVPPNMGWKLAPRHLRTYSMRQIEQALPPF